MQKPIRAKQISQKPLLRCRIETAEDIVQEKQISS
jgi:hypothetical protein